MADSKQPIIIKRVKGHGGHGHHGGAWKVAYADFVTAMMAFFLVMWLMGSDDETKAAIAHYFNHPNTPYRQGRDPKSDEVHPMGEKEGKGESILNGLDGATPEDMVQEPVRPVVNRELASHQEITEKVQSALDGQAYALDVSIEFLKFSIPESMLFEHETARLKPEGEARLDKIGKTLQTYRGFINIEGHTDNTGTAFGKFANAYEFSMARSVAVMNYLVERNWVSEDKLFPSGSGPRRSFASNQSAEGRARNRRIEFTLSLKRSP